MKTHETLTPTHVLAILVSLFIIQISHAQTDADEAVVRAIADAYIEATCQGNVANLTKVFHESAVMNGYLAGKLESGGAQPFIDRIKNSPSLKPAGAPYYATIDYQHVSGKAASVTISETGFGDMNFIN